MSYDRLQCNPKLLTGLEIHTHSWKSNDSLKGRRYSDSSVKTKSIYGIKVNVHKSFPTLRLPESFVFFTYWENNTCLGCCMPGKKLKSKNWKKEYLVTLYIVKNLFQFYIIDGGVEWRKLRLFLFNWFPLLYR